MRGRQAKLADKLLALLDWLPASVALWDTDVRLRYGNRRASPGSGDRIGRCSAPTCPSWSWRTRWR